MIDNAAILFVVVFNFSFSSRLFDLLPVPHTSLRSCYFSFVVDDDDEDVEGRNVQENYIWNPFPALRINVADLLLTHFASPRLPFRSVPRPGTSIAARDATSAILCMFNFRRSETMEQQETLRTRAFVSLPPLRLLRWGGGECGRNESTPPISDSGGVDGE